MDLLPLIGVALGLAMDAFSVAIAVGVSLGHVKPRQCFRLTFHFGLFQALMPIVGWLVGSAFARYIADYDHWFAFGLLAYVGGKMIWESIFDHKEQLKGDPTRGASLVLLSVATSIDALAVGLSMALLGVSVFFPALVIGLVAASLTFVGTCVGRLAGAMLGIWMERAGGLILIAIGVKIVLEHLGG